jgi:GAF domain-containing protein
LPVAHPSDSPSTSGGGTGRHLFDAGRVEALRAVGLTRVSDPDMERFAQRVRDQLHVPVSLVSLVEVDQQVFPGMCGLPAPWSERRATPLSHSFCQHVVESGEPLVIADARTDPLVRDNLAVSEIGVVAYAGMPLTDDDGHVLGSLCAIDSEVRHWSPDELRLLADVARDCRNELRLRLSRLDARRERQRRDQVEALLELQVSRSRRMLSIAESLNETRTEDGVRARLTRLVDGIPGFRSVRLHLADVLESEVLSPAVVEAARRGELVCEPDLRTGSAVSPGSGPTLLAGLQAHHAGDDVRAVVCAPVTGSGGLLGVLEMLWTVPRPLDEQEHTMSSTLASYVAQALERAHLIERRIAVAHQLQSAMLTTLPDVPGLPMAACYVPATAEEWVGGDWYDAIVLPPTDPAHDLVVAITVGDVLGHDIPAAAVMGQARAMLRQAAFDRPGEGPADVITHFEQACEALDVEAQGSAVVAFLERTAATGAWTMTWTSAGHPPPILALPDGSVRRLDLSAEEQGMLFGYRDVFDAPREDSRVELPAGSTVLFYSDGVIELPGVHLDVQMDELGDLLQIEHLRGPQAVVDAISMQFGSGYDDVVALAVQVPLPD